MFNINLTNRGTRKLFLDSIIVKGPNYTPGSGHMLNRHWPYRQGTGPKMGRRWDYWSEPDLDVFGITE